MHISEKSSTFAADFYYDDFGKYNKKVSPDLLRDVLRSVVMQIGNKFVYSQVEGNYSIYEVKKALKLLCHAGLIYKVQHTAIPLYAISNI